MRKSLTVINLKMATNKKRKVDTESRIFQEKWTIDYFFTQINEKPVCLLCSESVSVMIEYNVRRHYVTKHSAKYDSFQGERRKEKVQNMIRNLKQQQSIFTKKSDNADNLLRASYIVSEKIAKHSKNYSDGEFVKDCLIVVAECLCPEKKNDFDNICLSRRTITRHIEELATNIESTLKELASKFVYYSLAIDESTDITSTAQLAVFVRGIDQEFNITEEMLGLQVRGIDREFNITEEMLGLQAMKDTTTGDDIFNEVKALMTKFNLQLQNLRGFSTDGAPAMVGSRAGVSSLVGSRAGVSSLIKKELASNNVDMHDFTAFHCIIHQQNLCAKSVKFDHIMKKAVSTINFIESRALNHHQFQQFLEDVEAECGDLIYY